MQTATHLLNADIRLEGAPNFRDIGGYLTTAGQYVRCGRIFRSDALNHLTEQDYAVLSEIGVRLVCDLRSDLERTLKPTLWPPYLLPMTWAIDVNVDLRAGNSQLINMLRKDPNERGAIAMMSHVYRSVPDALVRHLGKLFTAITQDECLPLILHCSVGKDRTGVMSAILLLALGVPRDTVIADYLKTNEYQNVMNLEKRIVEFLEPILDVPPRREIVDVMIGARQIYLDIALDTIESGYGSVESYLETAGVDKAQLKKFRSCMLE